MKWGTFDFEKDEVDRAGKSISISISISKISSEKSSILKPNVSFSSRKEHTFIYHSSLNDPISTATSSSVQIKNSYLSTNIPTIFWFLFSKYVLNIM